MTASEPSNGICYLLAAELTASDVQAIAALHCQALKSGFLSRLGPAFLELLYGTMRDASEGILIGARDGGRIVGFVAGTTSTGHLYRVFLGHHFFRGGLILLPHLCSPARLRRVLETLLYPFQKAKAGREQEPTPSGELLSIAVSEGHRGCGVAQELYERLCDEFCRRGHTGFRIIVGEDLARARCFYEKMGARQVKQVSVHRGAASLMLVQDLGPPAGQV